MLFSSNIFLFQFLPIALSLYLIAHFAFKNRTLDNTLIVLMSCYFYFWGSGKFFFLFVFSILFNYFLGDSLFYQTKLKFRKFCLTAGIAINLIFLGYFKYYNFFHAQVAQALRASFQIEISEISTIFLPIGISFYTFMAISYLVETYRKQTRARSIVDFATYFTMFPHLVAGPIVRYSDIESEMETREITPGSLFDGTVRFTIGLGKKILLANPIGLASDKIFALPSSELSTHLAWLGALCYSLQIFFDFSGYSDMAIGLAKFFGFTFPPNFNHPYRSKSITEFWRRWHMSLSFWFRDFLYIPLGGSKGGPFRTYLNLFIVFFLCGLWHGASWHFIAWGLFHGFFLVIERIGRIHFNWTYSKWWNLPLTFLIVLLGWVLFRAPTLESALSFYKAMFGFSSVSTFQYYQWRYFLPMPTLFFLLIGLLISFIDLKSVFGERKTFKSELLQGSFAIGIFLLSVAYLSKTVFSPFIYFQF